MVAITGGRGRVWPGRTARAIADFCLVCPGPFRAGKLGDAAAFWRDEILEGVGEDEIRHVWDILENVFDIEAQFAIPGEQPGEWIPTGPPPPSSAPNRVEPRFWDFVSQAVADAVASGAARKVTTRPHTVLPIGVEPDKPRMFLNARTLNRHTRTRSFRMTGGVGEVPGIAPRGSLFSSVDHKSGYHQVGVAEHCWTYFGMEWEGQYYVWTVLIFGYSLSPWVYQTLSDHVSRYVCRCGVPCLSWVDDFLAVGTLVGLYDVSPSDPFSPARAQAAFHAGRRAVFILVATMVLAGYFVALAKSVLEPTSMIKYLGFLHDSEQQRYIVPPDKVERFLVLVRGILAARAAPFQTLEKVHGKAVAFSFAVPAAGVFVRSMQHALTDAMRRDARARASNNPIPVPVVGDLANDLQAWCALEGDLNGGPWLRPDHWAFRLRMDSDASSRRWVACCSFHQLPGRRRVVGQCFGPPASSNRRWNCHWILM